MDHLTFFFKCYGFEDVTYFAVVFKANNDRANIALSNILGILHSLCDNKNLNLEVEDMHNINPVLCKLLEEVGCVGSSVYL